MTLHTAVPVGRWSAHCLLLGFLSACASVPRGDVAGAIAAADRDAKRAVSMESQIDAGRVPARSLAVLPFSVADGDTLLQPIGYAMAEFMATDLSRSSALLMVDRFQIDAILRELDLVDKGIVDPRTAPRVGRLVGARRLLIGSIQARQGGTVEITARVVDVFASTVQTLVVASAPLDRVIDAEKALAIRVFAELGVTLTPAERIAVERRQTTDLAATVAYGRGLDAEARGDAAGAASSFEEAARRDAAFVAARATLRGAAVTSRSRASVGVARLLDLSTQGINPAAPTTLPEAVDPSLRLSQFVTLIFGVRDL